MQVQTKRRRRREPWQGDVEMGMLITELLKQKHVSIKAAAEALGMSYYALHRRLTGTVSFGVASLWVFAERHLNTSFVGLLQELESRPGSAWAA